MGKHWEGRFEILAFDKKQKGYQRDGGEISE